MLQEDPQKRLTIEQIGAHPWCKGPCATLEDVQQEFTRRKSAIDAENESKRLQHENEKNLKKQQLEKEKAKLKQFAPKQAYKNRGEGEGEEEEENKFELDQGRKIEDYVRIVHKQTELFSTFEPDVIFQTLQEFAGLQCLSHEVAKDKYKIKMTFLVGEGKKEQNIVMTAKLLKVNEEKVCLEIQRNEGDIFTFFNQFEQVKDYLGELIDAAY